MTFGAKLSLQGRFCARAQTGFCPTSSSPLPSHLPPSTIHRPPSTYRLPAFTFHFRSPSPSPASRSNSHLTFPVSVSYLLSPVTNLSPFIFYLSSPFSPLFPFSLLLSPVPSFFSSFPCFTAQQDNSPISSLSFPTLDPPVHSLVRKACQKHANLPHQESNRTD